jgi:two-component system, OmpR family, response regulator
LQAWCGVTFMFPAPFAIQGSMPSSPDELSESCRHRRYERRPRARQGFRKLAPREKRPMVPRHRRQKTQAAIRMRLLLVEDSPRLTELINETMHDAGWRLDGVSTLRDAEAAIAAREHDLVLLDLGLPDGDGLQLLQWIRREHVGLPVLIITARGSVDERIAGLDAGADDYLVKPFHHRELLSRCRAMLRRNPNAIQPVLEAGALRYDPATAELTCEGAVLPLPPRERSLIEILLREVGRVVPKRRLETALSEYGQELSSNALELAVSRVRKRLQSAETGVQIETVRGIGYLLRTV